MSWKDLTGDPEAGKSNEHATTDKAIPLGRGTGRANVQVVILTPEGRLVHVMTGYVEPKELMWELEQAMESYRRVKLAGATGDLDDQKRALVAHQDKIHGAYTKRVGKKAHWGIKRAKHDRDVVRQIPLEHIGAVKTATLTGGQRATFGYAAGGEDGRPSTPVRAGDGPVRRTTAEKRIDKRRTKLGLNKGRPAPIKRDLK